MAKNDRRRRDIVLEVHMTRDGLKLVETVRARYARNLGDVIGLHPVWLDLSTATKQERDKFLAAYGNAIMAELHKLGYAGYSIQGHGQNAKTGLIPLLPAGSPLPFKAPNDAIRLGRYFTEAHGGITEHKSVNVIVVDDGPDCHYPGVQDGTTLASPDLAPFPAQISMHMQVDANHAERRQALNKGMIYADESVPDNTIIVGKSSLKGQFAAIAKRVKRFTANIVLARHLLGVSGPMKVGYQWGNGMPAEWFGMIKDRAIEEIDNIREFLTDPLAHENVPIFDQGLRALLPYIANLYRATGNKDLLHTRSIAESIQNAASAMAQQAMITGGIVAQQFTALPLAPELVAIAEPRTVYVHPRYKKLFPTNKVIGIRYPVVTGHESARALFIEFSDLVPLGQPDPSTGSRGRFFMADIKTMAATGLDFDADAAGFIPVACQATAWWWNRQNHHESEEPKRLADELAIAQAVMRETISATGVPSPLWDLPAKFAGYKPDGSKKWVQDHYNSEELAWIAATRQRINTAQNGRLKGKPFTSRSEALAVALTANVGTPANLLTMITAAKHIHAKNKELMRYLVAAEVLMAAEVHKAADQVKHNAKPSRAAIAFATNTLAGAIEPEDIAFRHELKHGHERAPLHVTPDGNVNDPRNTLVTKATPLGKFMHQMGPILAKLPVVYDPAKLHNPTTFKTWIGPRPGPGYDVAIDALKHFNGLFRTINESPAPAHEKADRRSDLMSAWRSLWADWALTETAEWLEQAVSAIWQTAFAEERSKQTLLWNTHLPTVFALILKDWDKHAAKTGRLVGIGTATIKNGPQIVTVNKIVRWHDRDGMSLYAQLDKLGMFKLTTPLPLGWTGQIELTPKTNSTSTFRVL